MAFSVDIGTPQRMRATEAVDPTFSDRRPGFHLTRPVELTCFALCVANAVYLAASFVQGSWLIDPSGQAIATDFVNVWAGGRQALDGAPQAVYDVALHKGAEDAALGHGFEGDYPWIYPPTFLLAAMGLALLPYIPAQLLWFGLTFPAYVAAIRGVIGHRIGIFLACAYPGIVANAMVGQNGFATAALLGGALVCLERAPLLAGCFIGLLSFKPHLGVLLPLVLVAGGYWRVLVAAAVVTVLMAAASWGAFGGATWEAFLHALPVASQASLTEGRADWAKLQSVFGLVRMAGGPEGLAWAIQIGLAAIVTVLLVAMWRSKLPYELKAAALVTGTLLATPYIFLYDLVALAIPMAFLLRMQADSGEVPGEMLGLAGACLLIVVFPFVKAPVGLAAVLVVALLITRRALHYPAVTVRAS
jgi:arabinofuranan 3-O-arabinosyltransferase